MDEDVGNKEIAKQEKHENVLTQIQQVGGSYQEWVENGSINLIWCGGGGRGVGGGVKMLNTSFW